MVDQSQQATKRNFAAAAATLWVATVGTLVSPLLYVACLPGFLYLGVNSGQTAYQTWRQERRLSLAATETAVVALCVWQGHFLAGALGFSLYHLGRVVDNERRKPAQPVVGWQSPEWAWRQSPAGEVVTPVSALQSGDYVMVHASEMAPCTDDVKLDQLDILFEFANKLSNNIALNLLSGASVLLLGLKFVTVEALATIQILTGVGIASKPLLDKAQR